MGGFMNMKEILNTEIRVDLKKPLKKFGQKLFGNGRGEKLAFIFRNIFLSLFAAMYPLYFVPMDIFVNNAADMPYPIKSLKRYLFFISMIVCAVILLLAFLLPKKANGWFCAAVFGLSLALYIQGTFLAANMGELDGTKYELTAWKIILSVLVWCAAFAAAFLLFVKFRDSFNAVVLFVMAALFAVQAISAINPQHRKWGALNIETITNGDVRPIITTDDLELYSTKRNLLVIVMDMYDSFYYDEAVKTAPDSVSEFDGFTYYRNTVGSYMTTYDCISYIFSGKEITEEQPAYSDETFYKLVNEKFKANIYSDPTVPPVYIHEKYTENYYSKKITFADTREYSAKIFKLAFFRCAPEPLKPLFWISSDEMTDFDIDKLDGHTKFSLSNYAFFSDPNTVFRSTDEEVFKYIHLNGLHYPCDTTIDLQYDSSKEVPEDITAIAANKTLNRYFAYLKENGFYDNSDILVLADHGIEQNHKKMFPLLMFKPAHQTGEGIKISNAPISYDDIFPTLMYLAGEDPQERTIFDIGENEQRVRHFYPTNEDVYGNIKD